MAEDIINEIRRTFEELSKAVQKTVEEAVKTTSETVRRVTVEQGVKIKEQDDTAIVEIDMPGLEPGDISIYISKEGDYIRAEGARGDRKYSRRVYLPFKVEPSTASASYKNGVLTLTFKKAKPQEIQIKVE
ncbi:MAG: Hsp20/alpha crystallin family protein [Thermoproteus sp. AZ2]|jgi:HSP20 family protein|uniref:Hsp20/alpha crystallin family protein n=1 Tax=Thermoproteus sp. AZ2 TaxID=1609232 RepID=A0ACC6UZG0_9CREN